MADFSTINNFGTDSIKVPFQPDRSSEGGRVSYDQEPRQGPITLKLDQKRIQEQVVKTREKTS